MSDSFMEFLARQARDTERAYEPQISHIGQVARLREFLARYQAPCPFLVGDLVTPRGDGIARDAGAPSVILELRPRPEPDFGSADYGNISYGTRADMRIAKIAHGSIAAYWVESVHYEAYTEAHEKMSGAAVGVA